MKPVRVPFERYLAILGAAACLVITILLWQQISLQQGMWPLPGLYFIEIPLVCVIAAGLLLLERAVDRGAVWGSAGMLCAFSLLGAFSVGLYYFPVALIFIISGLAADLRGKDKILAHLWLFLAAGIVQGVLMLAAVRWLNP